MAPTLFQTFTLLSLLTLPGIQAYGYKHDHLEAHEIHKLLRRKAAAATTTTTTTAAVATTTTTSATTTSASPAVASPLPSGWGSLGCWTDSQNARALPAIQNYVSTMSEEYCISWCSSNGYPYAGVEYADECYCGTSIASTSTQVNMTDCAMACAGNSSELCGGPNRINIFKNTTYTPPVSGPATNAGPAGWGFIGCYTDNVNNRTLSMFYPQQASSMTVALCTQTCTTNGYTYAGVEYGGQCFCSTTLDQTKIAPDGMAGCNMVCAGNSSEYCGGSNRLDVYGKGQASIIAPKWASQGCYTDSTSARTLRYQLGVQGGYTNMTIEGCWAACQGQGFNISGLEYGQECWCDSAYQNGGGPASDGSAGCNMNCKGNSAEICGGSNRLNIFTYNPGSSSTSTTSSSTTSKTTSATSTTTGYSNSTTTKTSSTTTTTTASATPTTTGLPKGWSYRGCYIDNANGGRILGSEQDSSTMTVESCVNYCVGLNMSIAGIEYSTQCFCGTYMQNGGTISSQDSDCAMKCGGNSNETCGGPNRMSIYSTSANFTTYQTPAAVNSSLPGNWTYKGCLQDGNTRVLPYETDLPGNNLTVPYCLNLCGKYGYSAAGVEYGNQCFCGDDTDRVNAGAAYVAASSCSMACGGKPDTLCGGPLTLVSFDDRVLLLCTDLLQNYYTQPNPATWGQGTGNSAGLYQFLIGGPVIPLITTVGLNNKIMFVEKHGTSYAKNSTGAYELDLSQINNYTAAWRTMNGLQTDVFCSAGLTLPDKAGRQINIGGWSTQSLFGVRFYWPDGTPGVPGTHDWQENVQEVSLQVGRWYPSAIQMVNGSLLIVGGEDGSNGAPVPSLEILPKPPGGSPLFMDWLNRTDPLNLYPFLYVLPTGNIAVFYYNEARILDENTFQTIRTLPNIPGAVNNPNGGRNYPLEGTSVILPQYAPYTDPVTILICGGSTPYQGFALDNCVSIQPENPSSNWTIERMPAKRVMTCMTALPDGTFLILNGANQGQAGFGLANDPNHMAILYDPSKPVNQRMTRMANTTIDRLYHSEAILLPDGRVLVSGSDPEDNTHVQEYRVEVFIPPYLMANNTRPTYSFVNNATDWSYSGSYQIKLGTAGSCAKIALMGAVSSTHGNSMGQRSLFPAFSCSGVTCTITAPPNGHVTGGPGWFMLFVLNAAGTPSISQWIRIGGDPAGLGNWPNFPDFTLPGV